MSGGPFRFDLQYTAADGSALKIPLDRTVAEILVQSVIDTGMDRMEPDRSRTLLGRAKTQIGHVALTALFQQ